MPRRRHHVAANEKAPKSPARTSTRSSARLDIDEYASSANSGASAAMTYGAESRSQSRGGVPWNCATGKDTRTSPTSAIDACTSGFSAAKAGVRARVCTLKKRRPRRTETRQIGELARRQLLARPEDEEAIPKTTKTTRGGRSRAAVEPAIAAAGSTATTGTRPAPAERQRCDAAQKEATGSRPYSGSARAPARAGEPRRCPRRPSRTSSRSLWREE